jgi:hypothetical protein
MPPIKNPRHELFAQGVAKGENASQAYENAGYKPSRANACHLQQQANVSQRIAELLEQRRKRGEIASERAIAALAVDRKWVLSKLVQNAEQALVNNDRSAANRALELIGKEQGMFIERRETGQPGDFANLSTVEEIIARVKQDLGEQAAGALVSMLGQLSPPTLPQDEQQAANVSNINGLFN